MPHENNRNEGELHPMLDAQVKGFKDLLKASDIAKNAKQKLEEDFNAFVKAEKLSEIESAEHQESAADVVGDSMEVLQKSNKLSDKIQELKRELLKIKEQETEKLLDLNSAIVNAKVLEKDRKFDEAIKELESVADVNDSVDTRRSFNSEYGIRLDRARAALATLYVLSKEYEANKKELDGKREKIIEQLSRNEALRNLCTTIARESLKTPKAFEGIQNFKEWFDPAEIGFNPRFFDLPLEMQQSFVAELSSRVNELQINANIEKAPMPERMFFQAQQKMGAGDLIEATKLLLEYRKTAGAQNRSETAPAAAELRSDRDNPYAVRRASFLEETDGLLRKIALRHCDVVEADLQKLVDDRESQQFRSNENTDFGVAQSNIVRARELITSHKALTFSDAVKQLSLSYRSNDKYDLLFFVEASESKQEQVDLTKRAVESLNELGGSTKLSRDKLDRALSKELSSVEIQQKRKNELRALSNEEAVKHKQEAVVTLEAERDSVSARLTVLDAQLNGGRVLTDKERNSLWQEYNKLTLRLGALTTNGRADGEIKPAVVSQSVEKACDEMYRQLLRRDRYLALAQSGKVTELGKIVLLQKGLTMDNMPDKDFTALSTWIEAAQTHGNSLFSVDQVHQIFQTSCMIALEIAQMSAGSGLGSVVEYGLTKTFAKQLAKGGLRKVGIKAGIGLAKAAGEGFGSTAAMRTMGAMSLLAEGKDPAEAYDGFAKEWAQSTLMFTSIGAGNALMSGTLGRLAVTTEKGTTRAAQLTLKENPALWLAYNAGQLGVEVETLNAVDHLGAALGLTPNVSDDELQSKINHLANVLKYRAGGKLWNATALGHDMHRAEQELARKSQGVEQSARQESRSQNGKNKNEFSEPPVQELKTAQIKEPQTIIDTDDTLVPEAPHVDTSADTLAPAVKESSIMKTERGMPKLVFAPTETPIPAQSTQPLPRIETSTAQKNERPTVPGIPRIDFHKLAERAFTTLLKDKFGVDESVVAAVLHEIPKLSQDQIRSFLDSPDSLKAFAEKTVERNEKTARDITDFEKILNQTHRSLITLDVREQVRLVARGESPSGRIGEVLLGLKERDPLAYEIIQKSDPEMLVESGVLTAMVRGGEYRKTVENKDGKKLTIYMGSPIKDGGMGTIHYVGLVRDGESTMTFGAMKRAKEISFEDAARLLQTKKKSLKIEKLQAADTPVADDVQNPSNKPVDVTDETGELTDGAHDTALDIDVATFRDTQNKSRQHTLQKEALAQAKKALRDGRFVQALEITSDAIIYETNPHSGKAYDLVESRDKMTQPEIAGTLAEVIDGLQHLHRNGLIHGDIKPHNIMRIADTNGVMRTKIIDNTPVPIGRLLENSMLSPEAFLADIAYTPGYQRYSPQALRDEYYAMLDKGKAPLECAMAIGRAIDTVEITTTIFQQLGGESGELSKQSPDLYAMIKRIMGEASNSVDDPTAAPGDIAFAAKETTLVTLKNELLDLQRKTSSQTNTTPPLVPISSQDTLGISEVGGGT